MLCVITYQWKAKLKLKKNCIIAKYVHESSLRKTPSINDINKMSKSTITA